MTDRIPEALPVEIEGAVEFTEPRSSLVQTAVAIGLVLGLIVALVGVVLLAYEDRETPEALSVALGGIVGSLGTLLLPRRSA